jgi:hypothetical protein
MTLSSYSDIFGISHEHTHGEEILPGDLVQTGLNHYPQFEVLAVSGEKAWVRDVQTGADHLAQLNRLRKLESVRLSIAAE